MTAHHIRGNDKIANLTLHGQVVHQLQHEVFENHAQAARADFSLKSQLGDGFESFVGKAQADIFKFKEALVLLEKSVFGLGQNLHERGFVEIIHDASDRQAAHKFGNQPIAN